MVRLLNPQRNRWKGSTLHIRSPNGPLEQAPEVLKAIRLDVLVHVPLMAATIP